MNNKIIYLHGFNSSPQSMKARLMVAKMESIGRAADIIVPQLEPYPQQAVDQITQIVEDIKSEGCRFCFIGSSLGGYYATYFADRYQTRAVLINPSVRPYETLLACVGENENYYTYEKWRFDITHIDQLRAIDTLEISRPENFMVLIQKGDEVLDYRQAEKKYEDCRLIIEDGGDHSFLGFEDHIDDILTFIAV